MKKIILSTIALVAISFGANAETYTLDPHHSSVMWTASHFGFSNPTGKFSEIEGNLNLDEKNPTKSEINVIIKIANLVTGYVNFDNHLKSDDFFNAEKFPTATFVSKKITMTGKNTAKITGDLTLVGITKSIVLDAKLNKIDINPIVQKRTAGFSATSTIKRSDFGINYAVPAISDNIKLIIEAEANVVGDVKKDEVKK